MVARVGLIVVVGLTVLLVTTGTFSVVRADDGTVVEIKAVCVVNSIAAVVFVDITVVVLAADDLNTVVKNGLLVDVSIVGKNKIAYNCRSCC